MIFPVPAAPHRKRKLCVYRVNVGSNVFEFSGLRSVADRKYFPLQQRSRRPVGFSVGTGSIHKISQESTGMSEVIYMQKALSSTPFIFL